MSDQDSTTSHVDSEEVPGDQCGKKIPDASPSPPNQLLRQNPIHPISLDQAENLGGAMGDNNMVVDVWDQAATAQLDGDQAENPPENP